MSRDLSPGKVERAIPLRDDRASCTIADNGGRTSRRSAAGMAADLFETYVVTFDRHHGAAPRSSFAGQDEILET